MRYQSPSTCLELEEFLKLYPNKTAAYELLDDFSNGFKIKYSGPRLALETKNLKYVFINPTVDQSPITCLLRNNTYWRTSQIRNRPILKRSSSSTQIYFIFYFL
jgi:hypothetical protein